MGANRASDRISFTGIGWTVMDSLKRLACLLLAAVVGLSGAVGYAYLTWSDHQTVVGSLTKSEAEFYEQEYIFEICIIFFAFIYFSGRGFAIVFRAPDLASEIQRRGNWHLTILECMLGLIILSRVWFTTKHGWHGFDNVFAFLLIGALLALAIIFQLKIGLKKK